MVPNKGITLWGASATGKTSFLAALHTALVDEKTDWRLRGEDPPSTRELVSLTYTLVNERLFPEATTNLREYNWSLVGKVPGAAREWHWYGPRRHPEDVVIPLHVVDVAGEVAHANRPQGREVTRQFVSNLENSTGILFFYDPVRDFEQGDAYEHTFGVLAELDSQLKPHGKLPHYVAVCITKFDEHRMLDAAERMHMVERDIDPPYFPRVPETDAREFFAKLCRLSRTQTAHRVLPLLEGTFDPRRIRFFVTSAIGFYVDPYTGVFNPQDYQQHIPRTTPNEAPRIRGDIRSINVVEPMIWLGAQVARTAGR
jgi:hypothetical protein